MAFTQVQGQENHSASTTALTITTGATVAGNLVILDIVYDHTNQISSVTDNKGNTYAAVGSETGIGSLGVNQYYGVQIVGGTTSITVNFSTTVQVSVALNEYSGNAATNSAAFDKSNVSGSFSGTSSTLSFLPSNNGELVVAGVYADGTVGSPAAGVGYTNGGYTNSIYFAFAEYNLSASTSETATASWTTTRNWVEIMTAFKPLDKLITTSNTVTTSENVILLPISFINVSDSSSISESRTVFLDTSLNKSLQDSSTLSESIQLVVNGNITVSDTSTMSENNLQIAMTDDRNLNVSDTTTTGENVLCTIIGLPLNIVVTPGIQDISGPVIWR